MTYNGWTNYDTWNVVLWFDNDGEGLAEYVAEFAGAWDWDLNRDCVNDACAYCGLVDALDLWHDMTPDKVAWDSPSLNHDELHGWLEGKAKEN